MRLEKQAYRTDDDPFFYDLWKNKLRSYELEITFVGILDEYRAHRPEEKAQSSGVSFNATLNGKKADIPQAVQKLPQSERDDILEKLKQRASEFSSAANLAIGGDTDLPMETISFYAATVSPAVVNAAITYPLRNSWILDSGSNVNVTNDRTRFETY
ncbi:uncharacterized protein N7496_008240 [Penicillium cataractarum]|uniref:Uncharacterized protein n=1 Tax=Penicillium cataractarum TaxID=2100454 RepID=A0A9W9RY99_9EURO|nr:uncharacterized protein N7496_008240 [Penicillium cataractarum]KAJ5368480.1 hypothetical protein N7496_008240 [Penicillium cataractarum]